MPEQHSDRQETRTTRNQRRQKRGDQSRPRSRARSANEAPSSPAKGGLNRRTVLGLLVGGGGILAGAGRAIPTPVGTEPSPPIGSEGAEGQSQATSLSFEATPATVAQAGLSGTAYKLERERSPTVTREVSVAGQSKTVSATNHLKTYRKSVALGSAEEHKAAVFALVSTPQVTVLGQTLNPINDLSNSELLARLETEFDTLEIGAKINSTTVSTLGERVDVEKYNGRAAIQGFSGEFYGHFARFSHGNDIIVAAGGYPQQVPGEARSMYELISSIRH